MKNYILAALSTPPKGAKSLSSQIGYCFVIIMSILIVISMMVSDAYTAILKQDRSDALMSAAASTAIASAHLPLQEGMDYKENIPTYRLGLETVKYTLNIYTKAGNSFLLVYSSSATANKDEQVTLEGAGESYQKAYNDQKVTVTTRTDKKGKYVAGIAPIISSEGTVSGLLEITMPLADYAYTENGISLSWGFTIVAIAVAMCMVYYEINKLLINIFGKPDRQLPKIIRYGLSGCQSIAFFSAMACSMPPLVTSSYILSKSPDLGNPIYSNIFIAAGYILFAIGFFGFRSLREKMVRSLTTRVSLVLSVFAAFLFLILSGAISNMFVYLALIMPIGFFLGMVLYFQREYRIYAGRLGYEDFSNTKILSTQYTGYLLGACVGAVMAGMLYERFGLLAVSLVCGLILLIVGIQALLFVQHCPPSPSGDLTLPSFIYALSSARSGAYIWSAVVTTGLQISFFFLYIPEFIRSLRMSIATVAFYYILFFFIGSVLLRLFFMLVPAKINTQGKILVAAFLQTTGFLLLAFLPSAKMLVATVALFALALSLQDFRQLEKYKEMLRPDKHAMARSILESSLSLGGIIGSFLFGSVFIFSNHTISLLIVTVFYAILLFAYPFSLLLFSQNHGKPNPPTNTRSSVDDTPYMSDYMETPMSSLPPENSYMPQQSPYAPQENPYASQQNPYALQNPYPTLNEPNERPFSDEGDDDMKIYSRGGDSF